MVVAMRRSAVCKCNIVYIERREIRIYGMAHWYTFAVCSAGCVVTERYTQVNTEHAYWVMCSCRHAHCMHHHPLGSPIACY